METAAGILAVFRVLELLPFLLQIVLVYSRNSCVELPKKNARHTTSLGELACTARSEFEQFLSWAPQSETEAGALALTPIGVTVHTILSSGRLSL